MASDRERLLHLAKSIADGDAIEVTPDASDVVRRLGALSSIRAFHRAQQRVTLRTLSKQPRIAGYEILKTIGAGGTGVVYEATQLNPRRRVALKVLRTALSGDQRQVRLFQREIQALALLKHHAIAAIHDAGSSDDGDPYFAMELVAGRPLYEFLAASEPVRSRADVRWRLKLFARVCDGIAYAHQRGIVHRDIKPSNIMICAETPSGDDKPLEPDVPIVKILDFGLAHLVTTDITLVSLTADTSRIQGTLPYMSPEQARGRPNDIDVRSDVYGLGVVLYELLTGRRPHEMSESPLHEAVRTIVEAPVPRPSTFTSAVRGDLETIVLKSVEKDPALRYQSVPELVGDVRRYQDEQPILARPPSASYQLRKLIRRHKVPFGFAASLFAVAVGAAIAMSVLFAGQRRERTRAEAASRRAEQVSGFLQEMLASVDPAAKGRDVTVRQILDDASESLSEQFADDPSTRADLHATIGNAYVALGFFDAAETHLGAALELRQTYLSAGDLQVAQSFDDLGVLLWNQGKYEEAKNSLQRGLEIRLQHERAVEPAIATSLQHLAAVVGEQGDFAVAESLSTRALAIRRRALGDNHPDVAVSLNGLALLRKNLGRVSDSEALAREALTIRRSVFEGDHPDIAESLVNLALILNSGGKHDEAQPLAVDGLAMWKRLHGDEHPDVAAILNIVAQVHTQLANYAEAEAAHREALRVQRATLDTDHPLVAASANNLSVVLQYQGKLDEADTMLREALRIWRAVHGDEHPYVATNINNLAFLSHSRGRLVEADSLFGHALELRRRIHGDEHGQVAFVLYNLAVLKHHSGAARVAEKTYREALDMRLRLRSKPGIGVGIAVALRDLGTLLTEQERHDEAAPLLQEARDFLRGKFGADHWQTALAENALGRCLIALARSDEAEELLRSSGDFILSDPPMPLPYKRYVLRRTAEFHEGQEHWARAAMFRSALAIIDGPIAER